MPHLYPCNSPRRAMQRLRSLGLASRMARKEKAWGDAAQRVRNRRLFWKNEGEQS